jgi:hypothetical protein
VTKIFAECASKEKSKRVFNTIFNRPAGARKSSFSKRVPHGPYIVDARGARFSSPWLSFVTSPSWFKCHERMI